MRHVFLCSAVSFEHGCRFVLTCVVPSESKVQTGRDTSPLGINHLLADPVLDVLPPVADVSADSESGWSFSSVSPLVEGSDGHAEVSSEFLDCHELFVGCHGVMVLVNPFHRLSSECRRPFQ